MNSPGTASRTVTSQDRTPAVAARCPSWLLLTAGAALIMLSGYRWGASLAAWAAPVPLLLYARRARTWREWLTLLAVMLAASHAQVAKIVSEPIPPWIVPSYAIPIALGGFLALPLAEWLRRNGGEPAGIYGYAALTAVADWIGYGASELGAWSATGNTQVESLALLQLVALTGLAGIGFLMGWAAALTAWILDGAPGTAGRWGHALAFAGALAAALAYGAIRLDSENQWTLTVAAVVTDLGLGMAGIPGEAELADNTNMLLQRTRLAAARGARVVIWNEAATLVDVAGESVLIQRACDLARELGVDLVVAYGVILATHPLSIDNKYVFVTSSGEVAETYRKHHPVPGEPSLRGTDPLRVLWRPYGRVAGAICYDYDFPAVAREHARLGADIIFVPASDWRGIDPVHTLMSRVRAIEGGFTVVRATRWAASAAFDAYGRVRGWMPVTEENDRVMVAVVPVRRVETLYARSGEVGAAAAGILLLGALVLAWRRSQAAQ